MAAITRSELTALVQARKRVKSTKNASSTSSTRHRQKTGNDHPDDAVDDFQKAVLQYEVSLYFDV